MALIDSDQLIHRLILQLCEKLEMFLSEFLSELKEEICRNPDVDLTPYTRMLAAKFRKWNRAWENYYISKLFLDLYAQDAQSLRRDLCTKLEPWDVSCKLKTLGTASARFPGRKLLIRFLYCSFPTYAYDSTYFSRIAALCDQVQIDHTGHAVVGVDPREDEIEWFLSGFKAAIRCDPDIDAAEYAGFKDTLVDIYYRTRSACEDRLIETLFLNLYAKDSQSLMTDKAQVLMLGTAKATPSQALKLLPTLYGALSSYIGEDFSWILAICDKVEKQKKQ